MSENELIAEAFTEMAQSYQGDMDHELSTFWGISYKAFIDKILSIAQVDRHERVLDIATGTAMIPQQLKMNPPGEPPALGLDITPAMLREGRKDISRNNLSGQVELVCASAMAMPFANQTFDVAICALGTHHMDVPFMLSEVRRVLVNGGRLVLSDVGATSFWRSPFGKLLLRLLLFKYGLSSQSARSRAEVEAIKNLRTAREWAQLLTNFGFRGITIDEIRPRYPWYPAGLTLAAER